jgi:phosphoenolpyruvate carboxykinase (ATP)
LHNVNPAILDPRDTYEEASEWSTKANNLASLFIENFEQYTDNNEGQRLIKAGPQL